MPMQIPADRALAKALLLRAGTPGLVLWTLLVGVVSLCNAQTTVQSVVGASPGESLGTVMAASFAAGSSSTELAVGSPERNAGLGASQGSVLWISDPNQPPIRAIAGPAAGYEFGYALDLRGDVDLDGLPDLLLGSPGADAGLGQNQGSVQIWTRSSPMAILSLNGVGASGRFGAAVAFLDDLNADGRSEFAIAAPDFDGPFGLAAGRITIHDGLNGAVIATLDGSEPGAHLGTSLAALNDLNGDGLSDLAAGASGYDGPFGPNAGAVEIYLSGSFNFHARLVGNQPSLGLGTTLLACDDLDGDGFPDLVVGNPQFNGAAGSDCGYVAAWNPHSLSRLWEAEGEIAESRFGAALACLPDLGGVGVSTIAIGAPSANGTGRVYGRDGATGLQSFLLVAEQAGTRFGASLAPARSHVGAADPELAVGEPSLDTPVLDGGRVSWFDLEASGSFRRWSLSTAARPLAATSFDMDSDGDEDVLVLHPDRIAIHWQGDASASRVLSDPFQVRAPTEYLLSPGAVGGSLLVVADPITTLPVVAVGRADGTLDIFVASGAPTCCTYSLSATSPVPINPNPSPTPITGLAPIIGPMGLSIYASGEGAPGEPGFVRRVLDPAGTPSLFPPALSGARYSCLLADDFNGDGVRDLAIGTRHTGTTGSVTILLGGPILAVAPGSPHALDIAPSGLTSAVLSSPGAGTELAVLGVGTQGTTSRLLLNWDALTGFAAPLDPGLPPLLAIAPQTLTTNVTGGLSVLGADGALRIVSGLTVGGFASSLLPPGLAAPGSHIAASLLSNPDGSTGQDDLLVVHSPFDRVSVLLSGANGASSVIPLSGCSPGVGPTIRLMGRPAPGNTSFGVKLANATPQSFAFLMAWFPQSDYEQPVITPVNGCGVLSVPGTFIQLPMFTDGLGEAVLPSPIPLDPYLLGRQLFLQWGILDGGPIHGVLTASEALQFRVGY